VPSAQVEPVYWSSSEILAVAAAGDPLATVKAILEVSLFVCVSANFAVVLKLPATLTSEVDLAGIDTSVGTRTSLSPAVWKPSLEALEDAFQKHDSPKHIISDQAKVFVGDAFAELLDNWNVKPRFGAIGKHGSISVTERVIKTLKYEWLKRVPIIKNFDHLTMLCKEFENWYNTWRPHMTLDGLRPDDVYYEKKPVKPKRDAKTVPCNIEHHRFQETRFTGYRLTKAA